MASFLDKIKVKTAVDERNKFDLSCDHLTTADWMEFLPVYNKEMVPKEKIDVHMSTTSRMLPLVRPTFGRANINNRAFFVPYRVLWKGWNDFITDTPHMPFHNTVPSPSQSIATKVPTFNLYEWKLLILNTSNGYVTTASSSSTYDLRIYNTANAGSQYYVYTEAGRRLIKFMESLGYHIPLDDNITSTTTVALGNTQYSALPLLAAAKIYMDWYWPSAYANTTAYTTVSAYFKLDGDGYDFTAGMLQNILNAIEFVYYDSDYFVSAWDNPSGPNAGLESRIAVRDVNTSSNTYPAAVVNFSNSGGLTGYPYVNTPGSSGSDPVASASPATSARTGSFNQFMVDALKSVTDYMKRHQLVGARALDRYLARFGVNLSAEKLDRSVYLGTHRVGLQFGDVTSHTDTKGLSSSQTGGASLGDYAGRGLAYGEGGFSYETDEYGQFIIISSIVPAIGYYQGNDRNNRHISRLEFWTPEFDNLGVQLMTKDEVIIDNTSQTSANSLGSSVMTTGGFGYVPRYAEYKVARDKVTGDWVIPSVAAGEDAWWLKRDLKLLYSSPTASGVQHNLQFISAADKRQYNRIFQNGQLTVSAPDYFKMIFHFDVASYSPMKKLYDEYEFDSHGKEVTEDVNGVKMN